MIQENKKGYPGRDSPTPLNIEQPTKVTNI